MGSEYTPSPVTCRRHEGDAGGDAQIAAGARLQGLTRPQEIAHPVREEEGSRGKEGKRGVSHATMCHTPLPGTKAPPGTKANSPNCRCSGDGKGGGGVGEVRAAVHGRGLDGRQAGVLLLAGMNGVPPQAPRPTYLIVAAVAMA